MKAIQFPAKSTLRGVDLAIPELRPGHALVRVRASGLCHTDIAVLQGGYGEGTYPLIPGHEFAGVVEAVASDVHNIKVGGRVVVDPNIPCERCRQCRRGLFNLCTQLKAYGVTENGGFAEYCLVDAEHLVDIGMLPFETAALAEPLACVLNGLNAAGMYDASARRYESALVIGAGPIGMLLAFSLRSVGLPHVAVADINDQRLAMAQEFGFRPLRSGSDELRGASRSFDFVADATGIPKVVEGMIDHTADGGTVLVFGVCAPDDRILLSPFEIFRRQIRVCGSHSLNKNIVQALGVLERDPAIGRLVSHRLSLREVEPFFTKDSSTKAAMKVQYVAAD